MLSKQRKHYHQSVSTLSIGAWWDTEETEDFNKLFNENNIRAKVFVLFFGLREDRSHKSALVWSGIHDTFLQKVDTGKNAEKLIKLKLKIIKVCKQIVNGNINARNFLKIYEAQLEVLKNKITSGAVDSNEDLWDFLKEHRPHENKYTMTVSEFFRAVDRINKKNKELQKTK